MAVADMMMGAAMLVLTFDGTASLYAAASLGGVAYGAMNSIYWPVRPILSWQISFWICNRLR